MTPRALVLAVCLAVCLAGCFTNSRGERNLCIPGADGLCPAPDLYHRFVPLQIVEPEPPGVLVRSFDDFSSGFEEIARDSTSQHVDFHGTTTEIDADRPVVACGPTCVAAWTDAEDATVLSAVRTATGWSTPEVHDGRTTQTAVASSGDLLLIAWLERETNGTARVELRRVDPAGGVIDRMTLAGGADPYYLALTAGPDGALVTWQRSQQTDPTMVFPASWLVAQLLAPDGTPSGPPLEAQLPAGGSLIVWMRPVPAAFVAGAYRVVHDQLPDDATWAVVDPVARTIGFAMVGAPDWRDAITSILAAANGALVALSPRSGGGSTIARVENDTVVSALGMPGGPPIIAPTADGYQLAYADDGSLAIERRDAALQLIDGPTSIADRYQIDNTTCAAGRHQDLGIIAMASVVALRRRRKRGGTSDIS